MPPSATQTLSQPGQSTSLAPAAPNTTPPSFMASFVAATAQWLLSSLGSQPPQSCQLPGPPGPTLGAANLNPDEARPPPTPDNFKVPANQVEHNLLITNLMAGGSLRHEAEATIASRKNAYNKALREYKKETGLNQKQLQTQLKKTTRSSKQNSSQSTENENGTTN